MSYNRVVASLIQIQLPIEIFAGLVIAVKSLPKINLDLLPNTRRLIANLKADIPAIYINLLPFVVPVAPAYRFRPTKLSTNSKHRLVRAHSKLSVEPLNRDFATELSSIYGSGYLLVVFGDNYSS